MACGLANGRALAENITPRWSRFPPAHAESDVGCSSAASTCWSRADRAVARGGRHATRRGARSSAGGGTRGVLQPPCRHSTVGAPRFLSPTPGGIYAAQPRCRRGPRPDDSRHQILHALGSQPAARVRATGIAVLSERVDIANARLALESGCVANLTACAGLVRTDPQAAGLPPQQLLLARTPSKGNKGLSTWRRSRGEAADPSRRSAGRASRAAAPRARRLPGGMSRRDGSAGQRCPGAPGARHGARSRQGNSFYSLTSPDSGDFMSDIRIGVIGGSGLYSMDGLVVREERRIATPFGEPSDPYVIGELEGKPVAFLARHGRGHHPAFGAELRANIFGFGAGVERLISVARWLDEDQYARPTSWFDQFMTDHQRRYVLRRRAGRPRLVADPVCPQLFGIFGARHARPAPRCTRAGRTLHGRTPVLDQGGVACIARKVSTSSA